MARLNLNGFLLISELNAIARMKALNEFARSFNPPILVTTGSS
jgi:hypothetical protein